MSAWPDRIKGRFHASDTHAESVAGGLSPAQLNWSPAPGVWSIGQCLEHLVMSNRDYLPAMRAGLAGKEKGSASEITPGWFGRWFLRTFIDPSPETKKAKAPPKISPGVSVDPEVLPSLLRGNAEAREFVDLAVQYDVNRVRFRNPFIPIIYFTIGTGLEALSRHQTRHLLQAERVRQSPGFPA
jgi:hypothetical protein